ncbi:MAG: HEAT repeat domain-containing protein [Leptospiraceae bacterium]|nr:HEAT repeat domain-containing protein [Leptospiraceae bacterium]MCK6381508.1 HEAT repeat domain-containing protein [Leptospiraceae bacterium]NUM41126.1 HEAT repeat domain-containing protein [Leptospiraceae bacterium]
MKTSLIATLLFFFASTVYSVEKGYFSEKLNEKNFLETNTMQDFSKNSNTTLITVKDDGDDSTDDDDSNKKDESAPKEGDKKAAPETKTEKARIEEAKSLILRYESRRNRSGENAIIRLLQKHPIPEVRAEAADALGRMRTGLKTLHRAIETDGYLVRQAAYNSIAIIGSQSSFKYFLRGTKSKYPEIRAASYKGLGKLRSSTGREIIVSEGLKSEDVKVLGAALEGLGYYNVAEDRTTFKKYIESSQIELVMQALIGLSHHRSKESLDLIYKTLEIKPNLAPFIRYIAYNLASNNQTFGATLVLVKLYLMTKDDDTKKYIEKVLAYRRNATGRYAIIKSNQATIKRSPNARGDRIITLSKGEIVKIKRVAPKLYKARIAGKILEDYYYLVQLAYDDGIVKKNYLEGWVYGAKIDVINISKTTGSDLRERETDDDEDEFDNSAVNKKEKKEEVKSEDDED